MWVYFAAGGAGRNQHIMSTPADKLKHGKQKFLSFRTGCLSPVVQRISDELHESLRFVLAVQQPVKG